MTDPVSAIMGLVDRFQLDAYTPYDYKKVLPSKYTAGQDWMAPTWTGEHRRRISAYVTLLAYRDNASRLLLRVLQQDEREVRDNRREYGDADLLIESIRSGLMGDQQSIVVDGAENYDPNGENQDPALLAAFERQQFLQQWAEDERLITKLIETERNAVSMGDGVYTLGWDSKRERVALRTWEPGYYFPVLTEDDDSEYPSKVHLAWELVNEDPRTTAIRVRRITYELRDVEPYRVPWEDEPATKACFLTDATYVLSAEHRSPDDFSEPAYYAEDEEGPVQERDLGIDFIPVIHIPNTVAEAHHYGQSALAKILQILDDIQATDSDLQAASAITGSPMLALSGDSIQSDLVLGPNKALKLGNNGSATVISGAEGLAGLASHRDDLLNRLTINARVSAAAIGRADAKDFASGIHLQLSFGPFSSLIDEMRLVRKDKNRLALKFVQRFYMLQGELDGEILDADIVYGSFLPSDQKATVDVVAVLIEKKLISRGTAMKMLQEVGIPIEDPAKEEAEIDARDYEGAIQLLEATGNEEAVSDKLGVQSGRPEQPDEGPGPVQPVAPIEPQE